MTQDSRTQRTHAVDGAWSPFDGRPIHETPSADGTVDERPSTVHADAAGWRPRIIEGGRGRTDAPERDAAPVDEDTAPVLDGPGVDVLDAAAADALAILDVPPSPADPADTPVVVETAPEPAAQAAVPEAPVLTPEAPATVPEVAPEAPAAPAQEATPHPTLHTPAQATPETPAPAQAVTETVGTPHSTPNWRAAVGWLNLYQILDQPLPPIRAIYETAWSSVAGRNGFDRFTEIVIVCGIGVPISIAARIVDAAGHSKWRLLGLAATGALWTAAALTAPVDTSTLAWWTLLGYWVSTVAIIPAVIKATE